MTDPNMDPLFEEEDSVFERYQEKFPGTVSPFFYATSNKAKIDKKLEKAIASGTPTSDKELGLGVPDDALS